jgi:homoserine dehydrogenase
MKKVSVGVIGFGTVGTGVVKILKKNAALLRRRLGVPIELKSIADLDTKTDRGVSLNKNILVSDAYKILDDPEIDIVVELIGGIKTAKKFILHAL